MQITRKEGVYFFLYLPFSSLHFRSLPSFLSNHPRSRKLAANVQKKVKRGFVRHSHLHLQPQCFVLQSSVSISFYTVHSICGNSWSIDRMVFFHHDNYCLPNDKVICMNLHLDFSFQRWWICLKVRCKNNYIHSFICFII